MSDQVFLVVRKSFMAYVRSVIGSFFAFLIFAVPTGVAYFYGNLWLAAAGALICVLVLMRGVYKLFYLASVRWIIDDEEVRTVEGILPWAKSDFRNPYETIFEAYYTFGFFAKLFGYGTLCIRRTEGMTTAQSETHMRDVGKASGLINAKIKELRKAQRQTTVTVATGGRSQVEELASLAALKANGDISAGDYEIMKRKIIGNDPGGQLEPTILPEMQSKAAS